jgi:16S rRNA (uracil1498-N3)-methyltransferase
MPRFFVPPAQCQTPTIFLTGREVHHALHVMRLRAGEQVTVLDGKGHEFVCEVQKFDRDKASLTVVDKRDIPLPSCQVTLLQGLPKGKIMDSIIQKATELGVSRILPLVSERVVAKLNKREGIQKREKWELIAIESIKQCGAAWLPQIEQPVTPKEFIAREERFEFALLASLQPGAAHPRKYFQTFQSEHERLPHSICVWVGPEGDFSPGELEMIKAAGALAITLGPRVLRTETAAIYCLAILNYELQSVTACSS